MRRKFVICRPLSHRDDELKHWWIALCRISANVCLHLWRNGDTVSAAFKGEQTDEEKLTSHYSGWCRTLEECVLLCEQRGIEYEVKYD